MSFASLAAALLITCIVEGIAVCGAVPLKRWMPACLAVNLITNPIVNVIMYPLEDSGLYWLWFAVSEIAVVAAEGFMYERMIHKPMKTCFTVSFITNLLSCVSGIMIFRIGIL